MGRARVVVIGSSNTDMVVRTPHIPAPGETVLGGRFLMAAGGKGANQAVAAARLQADTWFVGRVGNDLFGRQARRAIGEAGVRTDYLTTDDDLPSGVALISVDAEGQNSIVVAPGANGAVSPADVDRAMPALAECNVVALQLEVPLATVRHAIEAAARLGKRVVLNPAPAPDGPFDLAGVDVLVPNEGEACALAGVSPDSPTAYADAAHRLLRLGVGAVIVTLGALGAYMATSVETQHVPGHRVAAVDATAAGDCFTGALATGLAEGMELVQAVAFANTAAALSVSRAGAQPSLPTREEVEAARRRST